MGQSVNHPNHGGGSDGLVSLSTLIAGEPGSGKSLSVVQTGRADVLSGTSAITLGGGIAGDVLLKGVVILANATPVTATIAGMYSRDSSGTLSAANIVLTGSATVDVTHYFPVSLRNMAGALTITPSVSLKVVAIWDDA